MKQFLRGKVDTDVLSQLITMQKSELYDTALAIGKQIVKAARHRVESKRLDDRFNAELAQSLSFAVCTACHHLGMDLQNQETLNEHLMEEAFTVFVQDKARGDRRPQAEIVEDAKLEFFGFLEE